jgi:hypothetical protein
MARLITHLAVRVSPEELADLRHLAALQQAPVSSVVRAMIRDHLITWRRGGDVTLQLGAVTFTNKEI